MLARFCGEASDGIAVAENVVYVCQRVGFCRIETGCNVMERKYNPSERLMRDRLFVCGDFGAAKPVLTSNI
jgi:hypothetical protein